MAEAQNAVLDIMSQRPTASFTTKSLSKDLYKLFHMERRPAAVNTALNDLQEKGKVYSVAASERRKCRTWYLGRNPEVTPVHTEETSVHPQMDTRDAIFAEAAGCGGGIKKRTLVKNLMRKGFASSTVYTELRLMRALNILPPNIIESQLDVRSETKQEKPVPKPASQKRFEVLREREAEDMAEVSREQTMAKHCARCLAIPKEIAALHKEYEAKFVALHENHEAHKAWLRENCTGGESAQLQEIFEIEMPTQTTQIIDNRDQWPGKEGIAKYLEEAKLSSESNGNTQPPLWMKA